MIPVKISGGGSEVLAKVTRAGELVVAPVAYDTSTYREMSVDDQVYNFKSPVAAQQFIITGFLSVSDKSIAADAIVEIYEAGEIDSATVDKTLVKFAQTKNSVVAPTPLRIIVNPGVFVNAVTDDATIHMTLFGYFLDI